MAIVKPIKLMAIGGSLVTSTSIWMFDSKPAQTPQPMALESSASTDSDENINSYPKVPRLENRSGETIQNTKLKVSSIVQNSGAYFTLEGKSTDENKYLAFLQTEHSDFSIGWISTTRKQYKDFNRDEMKIKLYTKPSWESDTHKEEYGTELSQEQINELFGENLDEVKVKQLLLSLYRKTEWLPLTNPPTNQFYSQVVVHFDLSALKDLKIKHFQDFNKLKSYVKDKITSCKNDKEACIASIEELDVLETDKKSFFENLSNSK